MRKPLLLAAFFALATLASAEVIRCTDPAGNVSYTDGACPSGSKQVGRVSVPPPSPQGPDAGSPPPTAPQREPTEAAAQPTPAGPIIIDSRPSQPRPSSSNQDAAPTDYGYADPGPYPYANRPMPPRDMRPRLRNCDASGCKDTQGNHYNRSGQLDRFQSIDGKTCRPVGTTTVCR